MTENISISTFVFHFSMPHSVVDIELAEVLLHIAREGQKLVAGLFRVILISRDNHNHLHVFCQLSLHETIVCIVTDHLCRMHIYAVSVLENIIIM